MSEIMYDEVAVVGDRYSKGDWKYYTVHDNEVIKGFFGSYRWLSNFWNCPTYFEGLLYKNSESAYQAAKLSYGYRPHFINISAYDSKKLWRSFGPDSLIDKDAYSWDSRKSDVMKIILSDKFYRNPELRMLLLETENRLLEESNHWCDLYFGVCYCKKCNGKGDNQLGKILMKVRDFWR